VKALELDPDYVVAHQWYSEYLGVMGRHAESIAASERAVALEPTSALQIRELANSYRQAGRYDEAIERLLNADELIYNHPATMNYLVQAYWATGRPEDAIVAAYRWDERWGRFYELLASGRPQEAIASLESFAGDELTGQHRFNAYLLAGEHDEAIGLLEEFHQERYMTLPSILTDPLLAPIADEPRVVALRRRMRL
jgi:tetratricopeptide (TPR) repeat protein